MRAVPSVPHPGDFSSRLRSPAVAARVGMWLGVSFVLCFLTGLVSHWAQLASPAIPFPTGPAWGYRVTQGLHVVTGCAAVPLLLVKLWAVYPRLFERVDLRAGRQAALVGLERASIGVLVASAVFQLATGLANAAQWYPWREFSFRTAHYALAWVAIGALVLHVAVKLPVIRAALGADVDDSSLDRPAAREAGAVSRRALLRGTWAAAGVAVLATAGGTVPWLRRVSVLAVRTGEGPGGVPINKTAAAAGVLATAADPGWALDVRVDGAVAARLTLADLRALPQHTVDLPIACVEGWSAQGRWTGVRVRDVLAAAGATDGTDVVVTSLQERGPFTRTVLPAPFADDGRSLLALDLAGRPLDLDHGFPCRVIAPNRPGVLQTKWVSSLEVTT
jgi:hypothetical protein